MRKERLLVPMAGYKGYFVHKDGYIISDLKSKNLRLKTSLGGGGYEIVSCVHDSGKRRTVLIHRAVAIAFLRNDDNLPVVNHKNGIKTDNRIENLEWCSQQYNVIHSFKSLGRVHAKGSKSKLARFTASQVNEIKNRLSKGDSTTVIANDFCCPFSTINNIKRGIRYKEWEDFGWVE